MSKTKLVFFRSNDYASHIEQFFKQKNGIGFDYEIHDSDDVDKTFGLCHLGYNNEFDVHYFEIENERKFFLAKIAYGLREEELKNPERFFLSE